MAYKNKKMKAKNSFAHVPQDSFTMDCSNPKVHFDQYVDYGIKYIDKQIKGDNLKQTMKRKKK